MPKTQGAKELDPTLRARICELHSIGWGYKRIHKKHPDISLYCIRYTIQQEDKRNNQRSCPRSGQPKKLSIEQEAFLKQKIEEDAHIKMRELQATVDNSVSKTTIRRLFRNIHRKKWLQLDRPALEPHHAEQRLQWAQKYADFTPADWRRILWTDECSVERGKGARPIYTWNKPADQIRLRDVHTVRTGKGVKKMFWAGFKYNRRTGLVPLDGDPNSRRGGISASIIYDLYRSYLPDILESGDIFMQDNARVHTAYIVQQLLQELGINVMVWPPYSPDLNPIENLWALMKAIIYERHPELERAANTEEVLEQLIEAAKEA